MSPFSPLFGLYIDELRTYLDEIDGNSPCLFNTSIGILLYVVDVVLLFKSGAHLQRLLNKLYEFFTFSSLDVNLSKTKIMMFGHKKEIKARGILPRQGPN